MHKLTYVSNTLSLSSRNIHVSSVYTQQRRRCTTKKKEEGNLFHIHPSNQSSHSPSFPLETCKFLQSSMCTQHRRICTTKKKEEGNLFRIHLSHPFLHSLLSFLQRYARLFMLSNTTSNVMYQEDNQVCMFIYLSVLCCYVHRSHTCITLPTQLQVDSYSPSRKGLEKFFTQRRYKVHTHLSPQ